MELFVIEFKGDIEDNPPYATDSLESALAYLVEEYGYGKEIREEYEGQTFVNYTAPDPEDDRILIWRVRAGETPQVVWHFSGWHWTNDCNELPGGPLEQGKLTGHEKSLNDLAMQDY